MKKALSFFLSVVMMFAVQPNAVFVGEALENDKQQQNNIDNIKVLEEDVKKLVDDAERLGLKSTAQGRAAELLAELDDNSNAKDPSKLNGYYAQLEEARDELRSLIDDENKKQYAEQSVRSKRTQLQDEAKRTVLAGACRIDDAVVTADELIHEASRLLEKSDTTTSELTAVADKMDIALKNLTPVRQKAAALGAVVKDGLKSLDDLQNARTLYGSLLRSASIDITQLDALSDELDFAVHMKNEADIGKYVEKVKENVDALHAEAHQLYPKSLVALLNIFAPWATYFMGCYDRVEEYVKYAGIVGVLVTVLVADAVGKVVRGVCGGAKAAVELQRKNNVYPAASTVGYCHCV